MTTEQLRAFLLSSSRNQWLKSPGMKVYVRKAVHYCSRFQTGIRCVDIASIQIDPPNQGTFNKWYPAIRQTAIDFGAEAVFFESVLNPHFAAKLARMGMVQEPGMGWFDLF